MKKKLLNLIDKIIKKLELIRFNYSNDDEDENLAYSSLSPISNADRNGHYSKALFWALKNRKKEEIKNIALTGAYGSGKSSILKTFQKNYKGNDLKFLNISLATFKDEEPRYNEKDEAIKLEKNELLQRIETSILEQIFYHEEDNKIPDSRFKKIKSYSSIQLYLLSAGYLLFTLSIYNFYQPNFIQRIFKDITFNNMTIDVINYSGFIIITLGLFFIISKLVRIISAITINKLKIQNAEIGLGENLNKSIMNHHIDEILYFFSVRPYNVIIIEDLDRFRETEIFTKLREVNFLLNNSEKTKRKDIVFVYAVRDDMFNDKERTKFFDFIIPVIPVINSSNSSEILLKRKKEFKYKLSDHLIENISFFIDDMRLLHNISNEFYLYSKNLNETLNQDKLFAIITYKNIYPNDFMKLGNNEGDLYTALNSKTIFIKNSINEINLEIDKIKAQIIDYEKIFIVNIKDLRLLYLIRVIESLPGYRSFQINDETLTVDDVIDDENFEHIRTDNYQYNKTIYYNYGGTSTLVQESTTKFSEIEKRVDQTKSYAEKEKEIQDVKKGEITTLKTKIQKLEKLKLKTRHAKIAELIVPNQLPEIEISDDINKKLIIILLRNGYIAEDYFNYISLFHEESITRTDFQFQISIINSLKQPFDYKLAKIEKLIQRINLVDFQSEFILNFDLLDYLLSHSNEYESQLEAFFNKLIDESPDSIEFIKEYFEITTKLEIFIKILCDKWSNIWGVIDNNPDFTDKSKNAFLKSIIEYGSLEAIIEISKESTLKKNILDDPLFLNITDNHDKLKKVIKALKICFRKIDFENSSDEMLSFIYNYNHYQLNVELITSLVKKYGHFNKVDFDNSNYFAISTSNADKLIQYVSTNISEYITNVYLKISTNVNEQEDYLINLLNDENIELDIKNSIILQTNTKITKLSTINDSKLYDNLLENSGLLATWENLLFQYNNQVLEATEEEGEEKFDLEISKSSIAFINLIQNAQELSKIKISSKVGSKDNYNEFWKQLLQNDEIENKSYELITKANPWWHSDIKFSLISDFKIKALIDNNCLEPNFENFNSLKSNSDALNILFFEKRKSDYFKILDQLEFDSDDLLLVLKSTKLTNNEKLIILNTCSAETIITDNNLKSLSTILLSDNDFVIKDRILQSILTNMLVPVFDRVRLFNKNISKLDLTFITPYLTALGGNYTLITNRSIKAKIPKNNDNRELLEILVDKGYISSFSTKNSDYSVNHKRK